MAPVIAALCLSFVLPLPLETARHARGAAPAPALMEAAATTYRLNNYLLPAPLTPRNNMVLVKLRKSEEGETSRGLVLAASQRKIRDGEVAAAGPGLTHPESGQLLPTGVGAGDHVLCEEIVMEGEAIDYLGEKHRMLPDSRVVATLEGGVMSAATFKPSGERLLVRLPKAVEETASGIALAGLGDSGELPSQGEVVAVGPGQLNARGEHIPMPVAPGEFVVFGRYAGSELDFEDGFKYKVVFARECLAKW